MLVRLLRTHLRPHLPLLVGVIVLQLVSTGANLLLPSLNARIIDEGVATGDIGLIWRIGGQMLVIALVQIVCAIVAVWLGARAAMATGRDVRHALFERVVAFSRREVSRFGAPSLITRTTNDVQQVQMLVLMSALMMVMAPIMMIGGVVMALREDVGLSAVMLVAVPVLALSLTVLVYRMRPLFSRMQQMIDRLNRVVREQVAGIRVIRAFTREQQERDRFAVTNDELTDVSLRVGRLMALLWPLVTLIMNLASVAAMGLGADRILSGHLQVGQLTAFLSYLTMILMSVMMASMMLFMAPRAEVSAGRILEVLDTEGSVAPPTDPVRDLPRGGRLVFDRTTFSYPGADVPVLHDVSLVAAPGTTTAIIGSTGSGKSTLVSLVPRLIDVTAGSVRLDGVEVSRIDQELLWSRIGMVPQTAFLFSGTIASNLRLGRADATDEELWEALRIADAEEFVREYPDGLAAEVSQGGGNFSGGQRQRLAIARAVVKRPEVYVFDDSFSALDVATDARVRASLHTVTRQATVLVVAQRVSTIMGADRIVVLEAGRVIGTGSHEELLASCPTYAEIVDSQLAGVR